MKIEEAVNAINNSSDNIVVAKVMDNDVIEFKRSGSDSPFLRVPINAIAWCFVYEDWNYLYDIKATDLARVMDVIQQLLDTPVKDRFPEKKYRLRWIDDADGERNYVTHPGSGRWELEWEDEFTNCYTESELEQLKKDNPRLAPAIDAMKEEVKEYDRS